MTEKKFLTILSLILIVLSDGYFSAPAIHAKEELSIGERFHKDTSLTWRGAIVGIFRKKPAKPPQYKGYPGAKQIKLPEPAHKGMPVEEAIKKRRSRRVYSGKPLTLSQLSQLVFAAQGVTGKSFGQALRTAPSAGALYPFNVYLVVNNIDGLKKGLYHYAVTEHALRLVKEGDFRKKIIKAGLDQRMLGDSGVTFVLTSIFDRVRHKYGERGYRYAYMESGHISQNISLQAVSLGLGSVTVGAFIDEAVNDLLGIDGVYEAAIYLHAVGVP